jgi:hypothetical protein
MERDVPGRFRPADDRGRDIRVLNDRPWRLSPALGHHHEASSHDFSVKSSTIRRSSILPMIQNYALVAQTSANLILNG